LKNESSKWYRMADVSFSFVCVKTKPHASLPDA